MEDERHSETNGFGLPENWEDEMAVRAFALYVKEYINPNHAFMLPKWFIDARKKFSFDEVAPLFKREKK